MKTSSTTARFLGPSSNERHDMTLRKILAATDFSSEANAAVQHAVAICRRHEAELVLLHVCGAPPAVPTADAWAANQDLVKQMQALRRTQAEEDLEELTATIRADGVRVRSALGEGHAAAQIDELARQENVDLIVTGARGVGGTNLFIIGSVTEGVVRRADRNVLIARGDVRTFEKILMATDLTEASMAVIPMALDFATENSEVELLHVVEWGDYAPTIRGPHGSPAVDFKKLWGVALEEADKQLSRLLDGRGGTANITHRVTEGVAATAILERLEKGGHQLLVVGKTADATPRHERVAERVLRHANCPVLVARSVPATLHVV